MSENSITIRDSHLSVKYDVLTPENAMMKRETDEGIRHVMRAAVASTPNIVKTLKPEELYKIKSMPDGAVIFVDKAGNLTGTCIKNGKFAGHLRLEKLGPQVAHLVKGIALQIAFVHIANELHEIKRGIQQIESGIHDDRVSKVETGIKMYERATSLEMISNCIPNLQEGILKLQKEIKSDLNRIPNLKSGFFDNWFGESKTDELLRFYKRFSESFSMLIKGYECMIKCYASLSNINTESQKVVNDLEYFMKDLDFYQILELCRYLPSHHCSEETWRRLSISDFRDEYFSKLEFITKPQLQEYCVEINGKKLKELCSEL